VARSTYEVVRLQPRPPTNTSARSTDHKDDVHAVAGRRTDPDCRDALWRTDAAFDTTAADRADAAAPDAAAARAPAEVDDDGRSNEELLRRHQRRLPGRIS